VVRAEELGYTFKLTDTGTVSVTKVQKLVDSKENVKFAGLVPVKGHAETPLLHATWKPAT